MKRPPIAIVAPSLAAVALLAIAVPAPAQEQQPAGHVEQGVFVPEGSTLAEVLEQQAANKAQAEAAQKQTADNKARLDAYAQARAAYEAELVRLEAEKKANEAEAARIAAAHDAAMAKWREDVAACEKGDESRCAQPVED